MNYWPPGWSVRRRAITGSTQDDAIAAAKQNAPDRTAFLAEQQSAGRGRDGRAWASAPGNLHLSVLLRPPPAAPLGPCWAELAGIALFDALGGAALPGLALKTPNDLLLHGAKLAGLLVDTALTAAGTLDWVVIGAGVNLARAPTVPGRETARLPAPVPPDALAARFAAALDLRLARGWRDIHRSWAAATAAAPALAAAVPG